jgi:Gas vesicle synthesis protein GvpL/GvpF
VEPRGVWVYAITERVTAAPLSELKGVGRGPVRTVAAAGLTAVAEDVGLAEFGEEALRRNLEDLSWLEAAARAHHRVIDAVAQHVPLVPMRLATVYSGDTSIAAILAERSADFRAALVRISGRREWGVKAYAARPAGPGARDQANEQADPATGPGAAYLQRRRAQLAAGRDARRDAVAGGRIVHTELRQLAVSARLYPPQAPDLAGQPTPMVLNAAYLVAEERAEVFAAAVKNLAARHPSVQLALTGPWPAYSFAGDPDAEAPPEDAERPAHGGS